MNIVNNLAFTGSVAGVRTATIRATVGTATLEVLNGDDPLVDVDWLTVKLGDLGEGADVAFVNTDGLVSFRAETGLWYRWVLTGDAEGTMSGHRFGVN